MHTTKIATCNYCGSKTLLQPTARDGHELACGSCGAPLHEMKWLKAPAPQKPSQPAKKERRKAPKKESSSRRIQTEFDDDKRRKRKKPKRRKSFGRFLVEEIWDAIEDIVD